MEDLNNDEATPDYVDAEILPPEADAVDGEALTLPELIEDDRLVKKLLATGYQQVAPDAGQMKVMEFVDCDTCDQAVIGVIKLVPQDQVAAGAQEVPGGAPGSITIFYCPDGHTMQL